MWQQQQQQTVNLSVRHRLPTASDDLDPDLARLGSLGFTGCLSVVSFNSISPLKAALLHPDTSPVIITGPLARSNCGSSASANPYAAENTHHLSGRRGKESVCGIKVLLDKQLKSCET